MPLNNRDLVGKVKLGIKSSTFYICSSWINFKKQTYIKFVVLQVITSALLTHSVFADEYHYNNMLIGDRASGLAGAYSAISDDPSGLFYNPAGIVYAHTSNISANMNAYNFSQIRYKDVLGGQDWVRTSAALVPNFFGITQPLGSGTLGFSYAVTDSILEDQDQTFNDIPTAGTKFTMNFNNQTTANNIGPSYAMVINDKLSIGLTLYGYNRTEEKIASQSFDFPDTEPSDIYHWESIYSSVTEYGINPILGIMLAPIEKVSLGLTLSKILLLHSSTKTQQSCATSFIDEPTTGALCQPNSFNRIELASNIKRKYPFTVNLGAAYFASKKFMMSSSIWIYEAMNYNKSPLVNIAAGLEYYINSRFAVRMGGYTNFANTPKLTPNAVNEFNEHIDIVGGTMSLTHFTRTSSITFGATGTYGQGQAQVVDGNTKIQDVEYIGASIFISASNSF